MSTIAIYDGPKTAYRTLNVSRRSSCSSRSLPMRASGAAHCQHLQRPMDLYHADTGPMNSETLLNLCHAPTSLTPRNLRSERYIYLRSVSPCRRRIAVYQLRQTSTRDIASSSTSLYCRALLQRHISWIRGTQLLSVRRDAGITHFAATWALHRCP